MYDVTQINKHTRKKNWRKQIEAHKLCFFHFSLKYLNGWAFSAINNVCYLCIGCLYFYYYFCCCCCCSFKLFAAVFCLCYCWYCRLLEIDDTNLANFFFLVKTPKTNEHRFFFLFYMYAYSAQHNTPYEFLNICYYYGIPLLLFPCFFLAIYLMWFYFPFSDIFWVSVYT